MNECSSYLHGAHEKVLIKTLQPHYNSVPLLDLLKKQKHRSHEFMRPPDYLEAASTHVHFKSAISSSSLHHLDYHQQGNW